MIREIFLNGRKIEYNYTCKNVKNINLRIKSDGTVHVSANRWVSKSTLESFLISKAEFILAAIDKVKGRKAIGEKQYFKEDEVKNEILRLCEKAYPYFERLGVKYPVIKFRSMVSRWGSCHPVKGVLTFNIKLMYAPPECIEYVVLHEFTHFLEANHSENFYKELEKVCPYFREAKRKLKEIDIR